MICDNCKHCEWEEISDGNFERVGCNVCDALPYYEDDDCEEYEE